jgi:hypothetical protein
MAGREVGLINRNMQSQSSRFGDLGGAIFSLWATVQWLAPESTEVIGLRVANLATGGAEAQQEAASYCK